MTARRGTGVHIFTDSQRPATYDDLVRSARHAEACGFDGYFRSDHYQAMGDPLAPPGLTDAWVTLAGLARETSRVRLGTLVSSATFRLPGPLAIAAAQVDQMSGGRLDLGLGTGWYEPEHRAYGIPYPPIGERFDRLEEQLRILAGLWSTPVGERFTFIGDHYQLVDSPALPKPVQPGGPPIIVGGRGPKRTPEVAARFADEFNLPFKSVAATAEQFARVLEACSRVGRTKPPIILSAGISVACGRSDAQANRRAAILHEQTALPPEDAVCGPPALLVERIGEFVEVGTGRVYLRIVDPTDLDHLDLLAAEVLPHLS